MKHKYRGIISVIIAGLWVNASEFFRNNVLLKSYWAEHYKSLGMIFPSEQKNGMIWVIWGFLYAIAIYLISRKFNLVQTALISWFMAFVLMWAVTLNLNVLPIGILVYAVPLSLVEALVGSYICMRISPYS
jgi:hypothetical protein